MSTYNPETKRILIKNKFPVFDISLRKHIFGDRPIFSGYKAIFENERLDFHIIPAT